jgi:hypothetical protein
MDNFRNTAFYLMVWQTFLAILTSVLFIVLNDVEPSTALLVAANLALVFALVLMIRANRLDEARVVRTEFWCAVPMRCRPPGEVGRRMARRALEETWLRFAKGAAAVAIALSVLAYMSHGVAGSAWAEAAREHGATTLIGGKAMIGSAYRARLLPTN